MVQLVESETKEKEFLMKSVEYMKTFVNRMIDYLEGPDWKNNKQGSDYVVKKLDAAGITEVEIHITEWGSYHHSFMWGGWKVWNGEEVFAENGNIRVYGGGTVLSM